MGDKEQRAFQLSFNGFLKVDFQGSRVTSDGGLLLVRELDERLGLGKLIDEHLTDSRQGSNKKFPLADLVRQSVYSRLAGYEDLNDAVRVSADPTFRLLGSKKNWDRGGALTSRRQSFEAELLASEENLLGLMAVNRELVAQAEAQDQSERVVLDMDSTESPVHGQQEGSAYNGHFESTCYHPLLLFNQHGDCLAAKLRAGNVSSAEDWDELLLPEIERQQAEGKHVTLRADAAFAKPEIYEALEQRGVDYVIRMPANKNLELEIEDILFRPPGRPSAKPLVRYKSFRYQAASWSKPRRIVAKVELHPGELFARPGFLVTNKALPSRSVVCFYNKRGTAEQWIKEGKQATSWTRLSCHRFRANEVRLQLSVLAYTLGNLWRRLGLPSRIKSWSLTTLQHRLMKTGGRLVKHARYYWLLLAEGHLNRRLFGDMLRRLAALPVPGGELTHTAKLTASDGAVFDRFGHSISLSGQTIVVGAAFSDCAAGNNCGSAYVFEKPLGGWSGVLTETAKLTASDAAADDTFAWSVSISEDFIVMVAPADDCAAGGSCGAVYVFEEPLSGWSSALTESSKLTVNNANFSDQLGGSVSNWKNTVVGGIVNDSCGAAGSCGSVRVFGPNQLPVADAGPDQVVNPSPDGTARATLDGSGSFDPDGDPLTYTWHVSGLGTVTGVMPTVTLPAFSNGILLVVEDGKGGSDYDDVEIRVNFPPVANAGLDQEVSTSDPEGVTVFLNGLDSFDPNGDPLTFTWTGDFGSLTGRVVTPKLTWGTHNIVLKVVDPLGLADQDEVTVVVSDTRPPGLIVSPDQLLFTFDKVVPKAAQQLTLRSVRGPVSYSIPPAASWLLTRPDRGESTGETDTIQVLVDPAQPPGTYNEDLVILGNDNIMAMVPVTMIIPEGGVPAYPLMRLPDNPAVDAADFIVHGQPGHAVAGKSIVAIFGEGFVADGEFRAAAVPLPTSLGGVRVLFDDTPAPLFLVTRGLIHAQLPMGLQGPTGYGGLGRAGWHRWQQPSGQRG